MRTQQRLCRILGLVLSLGYLTLLYPVLCVAQPDEFYEELDTTLEEFVSADALVNYEGLKKNNKSLTNFLEKVKTLSAESFAEWNKKQQIVFWINTYNALILKSVINNYPIQSSFLRSLVYPKNSVQQIEGVFSKTTHVVMGSEVTLDKIEHDILREKFKEPRIHIALVCAAMGCPPLRRESYRAEKLDEQYNDQAKRYLQKYKNYRLDPVSRNIAVPKIFKWFIEDFSTYSAHEGGGYIAGDSAEKGVMGYIYNHLPPKDQLALARGNYTLSFLDYDWTLNDQSVGRKKSKLIPPGYN